MRPGSILPKLFLLSSLLAGSLQMGCSDGATPESSPTPIVHDTPPDESSPTPGATATPANTPGTTPETTPTPAGTPGSTPTPEPTSAPTPGDTPTATPGEPTATPTPPVDDDQDGYALEVDCNDQNPDIHPGAQEVCSAAGSGPTDDDCDGLADDADPDLASAPAPGSPPTWYLDADGDGYGDSSQTMTQCQAPSGYVSTGQDCNDQDSDYNPGELEVSCSDPHDYNCDGSVGYSDADQDGFAACQDCDDSSAQAYPGGLEVCDGQDNDCDGLTDDADSTIGSDPPAGTPVWYADKDGDGYGDPAASSPACLQPVGAVADSRDCNDADPSLNPGTVWYKDADGDGYGSESTVSQCQQPSGYVRTPGDCNDSSSSYNPASSLETCSDPNDYNCDGKVNYVDSDKDGFPACQDCNDTNAQVRPDASEVCNGVDDNCNAQTDEGVKTTWYLDSDGDGYGDPAKSLEACQSPGSSYLKVAGDCDDSQAAVNPGATEVCAPEGSAPVDDDCDGLIDDKDSSLSNPPTWYVDADGDGYGNGASSATQCTKPAGSVADATDCDDAKVAVNPAATEVCNSLDDDCDGLTDDKDSSLSNPATWYADMDGDGYGNPAASTKSCVAPAGYVADPGSPGGFDCDDTQVKVNPAGTEVCNNVDDDCDGVKDEQATDAKTWYADVDGDGYGNPASSQAVCTQPTGYVANSQDCNDAAAAVKPGAAELCNSVDDDCNGKVDDGAQGDLPACARTDCQAIHDEDPTAQSGLYWISPAGKAPYQAWCDMTSDGGGWTLVLQASSASAYVYSHYVWTDTTARSTLTPNPTQEQDSVSPAFYELKAADSRICMGDLAHCAGWRHALETPRNLANGTRMVTAQASAQDCVGERCGANSYPKNLRDVTNGSGAWTYHRFGYVNDVNAWGTSARVGFTGDGDTSDSSDTAVGIGLSCTSSCATSSTTGGPHNTGSGFYAYTGWATAPLDGPKQGFLFVRPRPAEYCGDKIDNDGDGLVDEGTPGASAQCPAKDCLALLAARPGIADGLYWIDPAGSGAPFQAWCDMTTDGGGWTAVLQASSTSAYLYSHPVWTQYAQAAGIPSAAVQEKDAVSPAFYKLKAVESRLCMTDLKHCVAWNHGEGTARDLSNGAKPPASQTYVEGCSDAKCGPATFPTALKTVTAGSTSSTWYRFGYVNDVNSWGTSTRIGFTGDGDSSDSADTVIGLGLTCAVNCPAGSTTNGAHNMGSGYYAYTGWATAPLDNALQGWLFVRARWRPDGSTGELCGDGIDNNGDGQVDEDELGDTPDCAADDCQMLLDNRPAADSGIYWIDADNTGLPLKTYCDMDTDGGGWTLVMQTSINSPFTYSHSAWTATTAASSLVQNLDPQINQDGVSPGFYTLRGGDSMLCMGDLLHCNGWLHSVDTPRNLANGVRVISTQTSASLCTTFNCGKNTLPKNMRDAAGGTTANTWHRWGYVNDVNSWGTSTRVGFTGDNDTSDSSDTIIGLGLSCTVNCPGGSVTGTAHNTGSGYYKYVAWGTAPLDNALEGFLFIR